MIKNCLFLIPVDLRDFAKENNAVLLAPFDEESEKILQVGKSGKLEFVSTKDMIGALTRAMNSKCYCGMLRKGVECMHCALKQDKFFENSIHWTYLRPLGQSLLNRLSKRLK